VIMLKAVNSIKYILSPFIGALFSHVSSGPDMPQSESKC
jgi:hypothetical protein